ENHASARAARSGIRPIPLFPNSESRDPGFLLIMFFSRQLPHHRYILVPVYQLLLLKELILEQKVLAVEEGQKIRFPHLIVRRRGLRGEPRLRDNARLI